MSCEKKNRRTSQLRKLPLVSLVSVRNFRSTSAHDKKTNCKALGFFALVGGWAAKCNLRKGQTSLRGDLERLNWQEARNVVSLCNGSKLGKSHAMFVPRSLFVTCSASRNCTSKTSTISESHAAHCKAGVATAGVFGHTHEQRRVY